MTELAQYWRALVAAPLILLAPQQARAAETLDFETTGCTFDGTTFCRLPGTYGDTGKVDVDYASIHLKSGAASPGLYRYGVGYGDLSGVVFAARSFEYAAQIRPTAAAGFELSLLDFDFASFAGRVPTLPFVITDLAGRVISEGVRSTGGTGHSAYAVNSVFGDGVVIRWGPNASDAGLDNIRYEVRAITSAVPEPGAWALMIIGFGLIGASLRQARSANWAPAR